MRMIIRNHRLLSLKFLASVMLNTDIQRNIHDSVEDADTALLLYQKYLELKEKGTFEERLVQIYEFGRENGYVGVFKSPSISTTSQTPPNSIEDQTNKE